MEDQRFNENNNYNDRQYGEQSCHQPYDGHQYREPAQQPPYEQQYREPMQPPYEQQYHKPAQQPPYEQQYREPAQQPPYEPQYREPAQQPPYEPQYREPVQPPHYTPQYHNYDNRYQQEQYYRNNNSRQYVKKEEKVNGLAVASMVVGIAGMLLATTVIFGILCGIVAIVLGIIASRKPGPKGFWIAGIVTDAVAIIIAILMIVLIANIFNMVMYDMDGFFPEFYDEFEFYDNYDYGFDLGNDDPIMWDYMKLPLT